MEPRTIDEYQELIKQLKAKIRKGEKKNLELVIKLTDKTKANEKEVRDANIDQAISLNKKAVRIQTIWRGYRQRRAFMQELRKIARSDLRGGIKINTNSTALAEIETAVKKIGLNLEMLFRACDSEGKDEVTLGEFKLFLKRLDLKKVSQAQINRFLHAIDEDCTGIISREEYHNCLAAYGVHAETSKRGSSTRTYEQECVIKFAAVLKARDVRPEEVYNFCDVDQTGTVAAMQLAKFIGNLSEPFQEKEIRGLVQYLDVDNNRKIPREVFIRELEKGMRVAGDDYKFKSPSRVDRYDDDNGYRSPPKKIGSFGTEHESPTEYEQIIKKGTKGTKGPKKPIELNQSEDYSSGPKNTVNTPQFNGSLGSKNREEPRVIKPVVVKKPVVKEKPQDSVTETELKLLKKIIVKMEMASKPVYQFLEKILLGMKDGAKGVTEAELKKTLDQDYAKVLNQDERTELVKDLDLNSNKSVDAAEIKSFYVTMARESKEKIISSKLLLISVAKTADVQKKSTEDFLKGYGIVSNKRYSVDEFQQKLNPLFDLPDEAASEVYKEFNDRGTGTVNVANLVETINSFRTANVEVKKPTAGGEKKPVAVVESKPENNMESAEITNKTLKKIIVQMEMDSKPIYLFLEKLLLSIKDSKGGISQTEALKLLEKDYSNKIMSEQERLTLISVLDSNTNGVVDFFEVKKFYITMARQSKEKVVSSRLLLISVAKTADMEKKSTEDFLKGYGIINTKRYTVEEFREKINPLFDLPETSDVYKEFNDKGTGTVNVASLVETINSFRTGQQVNAEVKKPATGGEKKPDNNANNVDSAEITNKALKKIIVQMEMDSKPIYLFLEKLLLNIKDSKGGISQAEAIKLLEKDYSNKVLSEQERLTLISVLDSNTNGVVDFFEVKKFYITMARQSKEKVVSSKLLLISVSKTADMEKKSTEDFLKGYGILNNKRYTVEEFREKINPLFDLPETSDVYKEFNDKGTGTVNVADLIKTIDSFRSVKIQITPPEDKTKTPPKKNDTKAPAVLPENVKDLLGLQLIETIEKTPKLETKDFKKALVKLELEDAPISWLLELLLQEMPDPKKGLPRTKVKQFIKEKSGDILNEVLLETILQKLDSDQEGIINVDDVQSFINSNAPVTKEVMISRELMIILFAKIAQAELLNTDKFFEKYGIRTYKKVSLAEFKTKMSEAIKLPPHYEAELWEEFNNGGTGYVEIVDIMAEMNEYRTDLAENGKISYKAAVHNIFEHVIYKTIIDEDQERVALESRAKNEETMDTFKRILKDKGIKPLEFFNVASKGSPTCTSAAFKNAILLYKTSLTDDDVTRIIKNIDVNQNQTLDFKFYEMVFMDDEALQSFKTKARGPRGAEEIDPISLGKIKDLLSELNKTPTDFFQECDTKGIKEITLVQLKAGIRRMFPCSRLYYSDVLKVMRSMDVQYSGIVTEKTFNSVMSKAKSGGGGSLLNEITKAINSVNDDNDQAEDLKTAVKKLKTVVNNPKYQNKPEELFKLFDLNKDQVVTRDEFLKALDGLDSKVFMSERQKVLLVNLADKNKNNQIEYTEFLELVGQVNPDQVKEAPKDTLKITVPLERRSSKSSRPSSVAEILDNIDQEANEQAFAKYMESIRISASDYYKSESTTIFNNQIAALKRCYEIIKDMEKRGVQAFDDPDFGPKHEKDHAESSLYANEDERPGGYPDPENILWFRMKDICPDKRPCFLNLDVNTNDVIQGEIGDCWLIGGFSVLATQDDYIRGFFEATAANLKEMKDKEMTDDEAYGMQTGLYPPMFHWLRQYGIYVIRFFRDYSWRYVIIDDKLPCYKYQEDSAPVLVFGKCRNHNEFWVPLLEKAYAKLHSCYENLIAGYIDDGLADMTGLVANKFTLQGPNGFPSTQVGSAESLWQKLMEFRMNNTMLGCSVKGNAGETEHEVMIDGEPVGILKNHAYSIIDVIELPNPNARNAHKSHRLLRIRNPWGTKEWTGKWSDGSPKLLQNIPRLNGYLRERAKKKKIEEFDPEADDGTFLICYKDWRYIYHNLYCCVNFPDEWSGIRFEDEWTKENSGGTPLKPDPDNVKTWAKNPQFVVTINHKVKKTTKMFISLGQTDGRTVRGMKFPFKDNINAVVFTVASLKAGEKKLEAFDASRVKKLSAIKEYRDVSIDIELDNGTYVIVPSTQKAGSTGKFFLNVYFECPKEDITIKKAGSDLKGEIIQEEEETALTTDKDLKAVLKLKTLAILCEDELEASLERSLSKSKSRKDSGGASIMEGGSVDSISSPYRKVKSQSVSGKGGDRTPRSVMDSEQANQMFNDIMRGIGLNDSDFFRPGCTTILNNGMACLKRCHEILRQMNQEGKRAWIDTEFGPPTNKEAGLEFICNEPEDPPTWVKDPDFTMWLHIKDVCPPEKHPHFLAHGADSGDVIQGDVGDCWLIGAMSVLASNNDAYIRGNFKPSDDNLTEIDDAEAEAMTKGLYPPMFHWLRQFGIYVIRFFKNYEWRYVIIDDRIPIEKLDDDSLYIIYGRCLAKDEFWVPLIEKAYAKLHNTYEATIGGFIDDGLTDMTGMASNKLIIQDVIGRKNEREKKDDFWKFLMEKNRQGSMMGCSILGKKGEVEADLVIDGERMGIKKLHAYSIIDVFELPAPEQQNYHKSHRILRIRNPWGKFEWQGKWSDQDSKFAEKIHKIEKYMREEKIRDPEYEILDTNATEDGTFLICYKDWRTHFNNLFLCIDFPTEWSGYRFKDQWTKENSGGFPNKDPIAWAKNPQFILEVTKPTNIFVGLGQQDGRLDKGGKFPFVEKINSVSVFIMKLKKGEEKEGIKEFDNARLVKMAKTKRYRDNSMYVDLPEAGAYAIIPSTELPRQVGDFFLNIYFGLAKNEFKLHKAKSSLKYEMILEEEEGNQHFDDNLKLVLKLKAREVIYESEAYLQERTLSQIFD